MSAIASVEIQHPQIYLIKTQLKTGLRILSIVLPIILFLTSLLTLFALGGYNLGPLNALSNLNYLDAWFLGVGSFLFLSVAAEHWMSSGYNTTFQERLQQTLAEQRFDRALTQAGDYWPIENDHLTNTLDITLPMYPNERRTAYLFFDGQTLHYQRTLPQGARNVREALYNFISQHNPELYQSASSETIIEDSYFVFPEINFEGQTMFYLLCRRNSGRNLYCFMSSNARHHFIENQVRDIVPH